MTDLTNTPKEKAPGACNTEGLTTDTKNKPNCATATPNSKAESTLIARLALAGHSVHLLREDGYLVSKWGYEFHAADLNELQAFAHRLGVHP